MIGRIDVGYVLLPNPWVNIDSENLTVVDLVMLHTVGCTLLNIANAIYRYEVEQQC